MSRITVRVHPRSGRNEVAQIAPAVLAVWTTAPPADGRANQAVMRQVAAWLGIAPTRLRLVRGATGRTKIFEVLEPPRSRDGRS